MISALLPCVDHFSGLFCYSTTEGLVQRSSRVRSCVLFLSFLSISLTTVGAFILVSLAIILPVPKITFNLLPHLTLQRVLPVVTVRDAEVPDKQQSPEERSNRRCDFGCEAATEDVHSRKGFAGCVYVLIKAAGRVNP